ncbi:Maf family protein [Akkermansiaceae bacterium]|nr:Maf family protein [Akkermansiaceae bacterium]
MQDFGSIPTLILASGSPRRQDLLKEAGVIFSVISPDVNELEAGALPARDLCLTNARLKASVVAVAHPESLVLASDTVVSLDGVVFGKPVDLEEAAENLRRFRNQTQEVMTGVVFQRGSEIEELIEISQVSFKNYSDQVIEDYLETVPVLDKAGGYAIQDHGEWLVEEIEGDYHNIVGLPLTKVLAHLAKLGFDLPQNDT